jgi:hypothetical protein
LIQKILEKTDISLKMGILLYGQNLKENLEKQHSIRLHMLMDIGYLTTFKIVCPVIEMSLMNLSVLFIVIIFNNPNLN